MLDGEDRSLTSGPRPGVRPPRVLHFACPRPPQANPMLLKSNGSAFDLDASAPEAPTPPESLREAGLTLAFLNDLILKALYLRGSMLGRDLGQFMCLPFKVV